jgi:hypothetical protein
LRRLLLFAALLVLVGLSSAFAASFSTQSEDIASFTTDVSISVPDNPTPFPNVIYVRGDSATPLGALSLVTPTANDNVKTKLLVLSTEAIGVQAGATKYFAWATPTAPAQGYSLTGDVTLSVEQKDGGANRMTAALLSCPADAPITTVTTGVSPCVQIAVGISPAVGGGNGFLTRTVSFPDVSATIPSGSQLRLKIVNRATDGATTLSTKDFTVQWGYGPSRPSELVVVP